MRKTRLIVTLVAALSCTAGVAWAGQHPHDHTGFFIGFNLGAGSADISIPNFVDTDREWGGAGNFRIGGAIKNNLLLGAESSAWVKDENGTTVSLSSLAFAVTYYPGELGFFLRGGAGFATSSVEVEIANGYTQSKSETGFGLQAAMGYEWRLTKKFAMGPQVEFVYLNIGGDLVDTANFFDATLGFNWYW